MDLVSTGLEWLGDLHAQSEDEAAASAAYEEALRVRQQVTEAPCQAELPVGHFIRLGQLHRKLGNVEAAISAYEEALATCRRQEVDLSHQRPLDIKGLTSMLLDLLGDARLTVGNVAGAWAALEERLALERWLFDWYGATPSAIRSLVDALTYVADARRAAGDPAGADDAEREAAQLWERLDEEPSG